MKWHKALGGRPVGRKSSDVRTTKPQRGDPLIRAILCGRLGRSAGAFVLVNLKFYRRAASLGQVSSVLVLVNDVEQPAPADFVPEVSIGVDGQPDEDSLAHNVVFGHETPEA